MRPAPSRPEPARDARRTRAETAEATRTPRPVYVGRILGPVCDPGDDDALYALRPAQTYLGDRIKLDPPERYDDPEHGPAPSVECYWEEFDRRDSLAAWRTRRGAEPRFRRRAQHVFTVLLVIALALVAFFLGTHF